MTVPYLLIAYALGLYLRHNLGSTSALFVLCLFLLVAPGCDRTPPIVPVSGKVTFGDGTPVKVGVVETICREHPSLQSRGEIQGDGSFVLTTTVGSSGKEKSGAVVGDHECVVVQFVMLEGATSTHASSQGVVHPRFSSYSKSGLKFTLPKEGLSDLHLTVEGIPKRGKQHSEHE